MNWIDLAIALLIIGGGVIGYISGLLWQLARLIGLVAAFFLTVKLFPLVSFHISGGSAGPALTKFIAYIIIFSCIYGAVFILTYFLEKLLKVMQLKTIDRILGAALGVFKAVFLCLIIIVGYVHFGGIEAESKIAESALGSAAYRIGKSGRGFMPKEALLYGAGGEKTAAAGEKQKEQPAR